MPPSWEVRMGVTQSPPPGVLPGQMLCAHILVYVTAESKHVPQAVWAKPPKHVRSQGLHLRAGELGGAWRHGQMREMGSSCLSFPSRCLREMTGSYPP